MTLPIVVAHRGYRSAAPENTLPAFAAAVKAGAQAIEMDVVLNAEGTPVVIHDETVDGTTNARGSVKDFTTAELKKLDAGSWFDPAFAGTTIPTFREFAQFMARHPHVGILLEFKGDWTATEVRTVFDIVTEFELTSRSMLQSFNPTTVASLHQVAPHSDRGFLIEVEHEDLIRKAAELGIYTINPDVTYLLTHPDLAARIKEAGMKVQVWTANKPEQWAALLALGVDAIIADNPGELKGWLSAQETP